MDRLYAPWRNGYVTQEEKIDGCVFCHIANNSHNDDKFHILYRDDWCFVIMNKYPYSPGHFMVIPYLHIDNIESLDSKIWVRMNLLAQQGVKLLRDVFNPAGINIGMNLGELAGAGIAEHIHLHLVPRWKGDTNFITTIGQTRVYSSDFEKIFLTLQSSAKLYFDKAKLPF